ncbi:MAG TPA: hypothetical protein VLW47_05370 [Thermodesulfobacteriota bacterium]|nr:hypothetical protein [Thermodesulfobacteriota bacterium]
MRLITIKTSISIKVSGGDFGLVDGIGHCTIIQDGSFTMVCQDGMVECIPTGETTTATTCGEARDGTTTQYIIMMFTPTGKLGTTQAVINRIGALPGATVMYRRPVMTSEALDRRQKLNRLQWRLARLLILVRTKMPLQACTEEAMHKPTATVVSKVARACPQKGKAV